ncbi:uncharacterized protein [Euwallacea fornicatus]|uniref:uncharacterized protein n=1 Tax=Euwallacea fornicatus TaxID=995702 RepID=UPI00338F3491
MNPGSSQESELDRESQDGGFRQPRTKKRGRKPNSTPTTPTTPTSQSKRPALDLTPSKKETTSSNKPTTIQHIYLKYNHTFTIFTTATYIRTQFAIKWDEINKRHKDIIIKQEENFLIETNEEEKAAEALQLLVNRKTVVSFKVQHNNATTLQKPTQDRRILASYSVVATGVDLDITDEMFANHLKGLNLQISFCKRIVSRQRGLPTLMMRLITGKLKTYEKLMNDRGVHFLGRVFRIVESKPPAPIPAPCGRCSQFDHRTEDCRTPTKCSKCQGPHSTASCESTLPVRCTSCHAEDHAAWSMKCPNRPTAPINGIPNVKIKCLNRRTAEVSKAITENSRIHMPITTHDHIINKYKHQINKTSNTNREELLKKLRKQFIDDFGIDTSVVFFGNHTYILMIDLLLPSRSSHTEPYHDQLRQTITNVENSI